MTQRDVLIVGSGHLAHRLEKLVRARGDTVIRLTDDAFGVARTADLTFDAITHAVRDVDLASLRMAYLVDDRDERNLGMVIALVSLCADLYVTAALFNESVAPHLRAANPRITILNPAKIAAPTFIKALDAPLERTLRYAPATRPGDVAAARPDRLVTRLLAGFGGIVAAAVTYFHFADHLSWIDSLYFVVVTVATVGYGDINLLNAGTASKLVGIGLILASTVFIWMIFSLTIDAIIKRRVQLALGRKRYSHENHVILCGLGRLGYFIAEGLLERGERVLIIERGETAPAIDYFRRRGADVYVGDARLPRVLDDAGVMHAKAVYSVINNDYTNLEIGLNARSFRPDLRLILRIFDDAMSRRIKDGLDIHLTFSMTGIADEQFAATLPAIQIGA